tara:strand:- start:42 stop:215 length:174 start_codon:yes stop_codon:yes gene_type:complete
MEYIIKPENKSEWIDHTTQWAILTDVNNDMGPLRIATVYDLKVAENLVKILELEELI